MTVLQHQLDALEESASDLSRGGNSAQSARRVEDLIAVALGMHQSLRAICDRWDRRIAKGRARYDLDEATSVWRHFVALNELMIRLSQAAAQLGASGQEVEGTGALEEARIEVGLIASVSPERDAASHEQAGVSKNRLMSEVRDGLRRRMGA